MYALSNGAIGPQRQPNAHAQPIDATLADLHSLSACAGVKLSQLPVLRPVNVAQ